MSASPSSQYIRRDFERVAPDTVRDASAFAASILADVAGRRGTMDGRIAALSPSLRMAGPASLPSLCIGRRPAPPA
jgi:hypothetical protein